MSLRGQEKDILNKYWPVLAALPGLGARGAKKLVINLLKTATMETERGGSFSRPENYGNILLDQGGTKEEAQRLEQIKKTDGVTNEDILWWWNLKELERRFLNNLDIFHRTALYLECKRQGLSEEQAIKKLLKFRPKWSITLEDSTDENRPLPAELMDRVNRYVIERFKSNPDKFKAECEKSTSFNALIRKEIQAKTL